jgi:hypothetical protein
MRFLLNKASATLSKRVPYQPIVTDMMEKISDDMITSVMKEKVQAWGQQCSPNCGCAIRFKADIDPEKRNQITMATYHAKTIITTESKSIDGRITLKPLLTQSRDEGGNGRPMLKECSCNTLHVLAKSITEFLPQLTLSQAQNQVEFSGLRSSTAFRYSVLKRHNLLRKDIKIVNNEIHHEQEGRCFDLVEEALVACLKGHIPRPRPYTKNSQLDTRKDSIDLNPLRFVEAAKKRAENSCRSHMNPPQHNDSETSKSSSMPPFHLMNGLNSVANDSIEYESLSSIRREADKSSPPVPDWVSYVDEAQKIE